jgi:hypothetical protein
MCGAVDLLIALAIGILAIVGPISWLAFRESSRQHVAAEGLLNNGLRDDAGLTSLERRHLRDLIANRFSNHANLELRTLASKSRKWLFVSVLFGGVVFVSLLVRTSALCT